MLTSVCFYCCMQGILAHFHDLWYKDTLRTKPKWLRICLDVRKQLGVISLWLLLLHVIGSCMFFNPAYLKKFFVDPKAYSSKMNWKGEVSFAAGVWATGFYMVMGVCSMPTIASAMTSKQWWFVFGPVAWLALVLGVLHVLVQGVTQWKNFSKWYGGMPQMTLTSTILPMFVMVMKIFQVIWWLFSRPKETKSADEKKISVSSTMDESGQEDAEDTPSDEQSYVAEVSPKIKI